MTKFDLVKCMSVAAIAGALMGAGGFRYWAMGHNAAQQARSDRACLMAVAEAVGKLKKPKLVSGPVKVYTTRTSTTR